MKHIEEHTFIIEYCKKKMSGHYKEFIQEIRMFKEAWPNVIVDPTETGRLEIGYRGASAYRLAHDSANMFVEAAKRHDWWEKTN